MDLNLEGKVAIVTGGSRGIGKSIARQLAREGVDVAIAARHIRALQETAREISGETSRKVVAISADTGDDNEVEKMIQRVANELGRIDILVNNAAVPGGQGQVPNMFQITNEVFWEDVNVKVMGYLRCVRGVVPYMKKQGWGRIINISGMAARQTGSIVGSIRNVSVSAMTKNLADELGTYGINVTVVHPGATRTERTPGLVKERSHDLGISAEEVEQNMFQSNSVNRIIDASEVAYVVTFLASPKSSAINGDAIAAGGGISSSIYY